MNSLRIRSIALPAYFLASLVLLGCTDEPTKETEALPQLKSEAPFAYVERNIISHAELMADQYDAKLSDIRQSPINAVTPYQFNPGAKLLVRDGLDVNANEVDVLSSYFGDSEYDVKNLNISPDGQSLIFAARGSDTHPTDSTWNIFVYDVTSKSLRRVIEDPILANSGHDTNPTITLENNIIFSSDRDAGNPLYPRENIELVGDMCRKVDPAENPSLIHSMTLSGNDITQLTYGRYNHDLHPTTLTDGRVAFVRWERSFTPLPSCLLTDKTEQTGFDKSHSYQSGLTAPNTWTDDEQCKLAHLTPNGAVLTTIHHKLLTITPDGKSMEQLYNTVTFSSSEDSLLAVDKIVQAENGNILGLVKHQYNPVFGGQLLEFLPIQQSESGTAFAEFAPSVLANKNINLYPGELSDDGWYAGFWPYRDGTSRLLTSWANCTLVSNGVSEFCENSQSGEGEQDVQYGLWMFDPASKSQSPIVRVKQDMVISDVAIFQSQKGNLLELEPYDPNFIDNEDATIIDCTFPNNAPIALAGIDQAGYLGNVFKFNGNQSSDPDGDPLTYHWSILSKPNKSEASLMDTSRVDPSFEPDVVGRYEIQLVVKDAELESAPDSLVLTVVFDNDKPIAVAGEDQNTTVGNIVNLDGSASSDPENQPLTYRWMVISQPEGSSAVLSDKSAVSPNLTPDQPGNYVIQLIVNDGVTDSAPDTVNVTAGQYVNNKPIANAGSDQQVAVGTPVTLNGSASSDPEGSPLSFSWAFVSVPNGSSASLYGGMSANPTFTPNEAGSYIVQLIVNDGELDSSADTVTVLVENENQRPIANAGLDQTGIVDQLVNLDGSGSRDPDGDSLSYSWEIISQPSEASASLSNPDNVNPSFATGVEGAYVVRLVVSDGNQSSTPDTVTITITGQNTKPIADAGVDQTSSLGEEVSLDGSRSSDADSDPLTYDWKTTSQPDGSSVVLVGPTSVNPKFTSDKKGDFVFQLVVNDGKEDSDKDTVVISVADPNGKPTAVAGDDQTGEVNDQFILDGSASSDPEGEPLTYQWALLQAPAGASANIVNSTAAIASIITDVAGNYQIQLVVNDGSMNSDPDMLMLEVSKLNNPPTANAGPDQRFTVGQTLMLDGSDSSDLDGDLLTYQWSIISPSDSDASLLDPTSVTPSITLRSKQVHQLELIVFDGKEYSAPDSVTLSFENTKPVADAGDDQTTSAGETVVVDGSGSTDADGDSLTYHWSIVSAPVESEASLSDASSVSPELIIDVNGTYELELVVNDGYINSDADRVLVNAIGNTAPVAIAGDDMSVNSGASISFDGSASYDIDGDSLEYSWSLIHQPESSSAVLQNPTTSSPSLTVDVYGEYVVQLIVNDGQVDSLPDTLLLTSQNVAPIAIAGDDIELKLGESANLDGSSSYDPNGDPISYRWDLINKPSDSTVDLNNPNSKLADFTPDKVGTYVAQLIVNDGLVDSVPDTVQVIVTSGPDVCEISDDLTRVLPIVIRDFQESHPDFEYEIGTDRGIVANWLGEDRLPVYANEYGSTPTTTNKDNFDQWYRDVPGVNINIPKTLTIERQEGSTIWEYSNSSFFPIDDDGWGNSGLTTPDHNFHFTLETHLVFDYKGGEEFTFRGDDDLWLFINGQLVIDIGGVHAVQEQTVNIDEIAESLGITVGNRYSFDLFFAERHVTQSNFKFQTNIELECSE